MSLTRLRHRPETWIIAGLFVLTLLTRIPFRSQILFHWDSVNFAYAMREFNVVEEQPQPPGYIVYVWFCRLIDVLFGDPQTTMVWISVFASALAVVCLFCLGRSMFDTRTGLIAALFLVTSPLFWFYGEVALPHSLDTLLVVLSVWFLYETMQRNLQFLLPAVTVLAVAGGVRPQTLVFLGPLVLFSLRRVGWRRFMIAAGVGVVLCLAWFVPLMLLSGGIGGYLDTMGAYADRFQTTTDVFRGAGWWGLRRNVVKLTMYSLYAWGAALVPVVACGALLVWRRSRSLDRERSLFFGLWVVPTVGYYALVHMGQPGLVFVFLPVLLLWGARGTVCLLDLVRRPRWGMAGVGFVLLLNAAIFCLAPEYPLGDGGVRLWSRQALVNTDRYFSDRFAAIQAGSSRSTAILASSWHHAEYYLPAYVLFPFDIGSKWEKGEGKPAGDCGEAIAMPVELTLEADSQGQRTLIVFDPNLMALSEGPELARERSLEHGGTLYYYSLTAGQTFLLGPCYFRVEESR